MSTEQAIELCNQAFDILKTAQKTDKNQTLLSEAAGLYFQASQADETLAIPYMGLAMIFYATGHQKTALGLLNKAKTLEPTNHQLLRLNEQIKKGESIAKLKAPSAKKKRVASMRERDPEAMAKRPPIISRIFGPLDNLFEDAESLQAGIQAVFQTQLPDPTAQRLFEIMHEIPSDLAKTTQEIKAILAQIKPEYGRKLFDFGADLAKGFLEVPSTPPEEAPPKQTESTPTHSTPPSDLGALKGKFADPRALYQALKTRCGVDLAKPKVKALYSLIETGVFLEGRPFTPQDLPRFQQLMGELHLLDKQALKSSGELGSDYGKFTQKAVSMLIEKLESVSAS